jgi:hypothetical protein
MDIPLTESKIKVMLQCPRGHSLYKEGITVGALYKGKTIRLMKSQCVKKGYDWSKAEKLCQKHGHTLTTIEKNKNAAFCGTYRLNDIQWKRLQRKCRECM